MFHSTIIGNVLVSSIKVECCIEGETRESKLERDKENKRQRRGEPIKVATCNHQADSMLYVGILYLIWYATPEWRNAVYDC